MRIECFHYLGQEAREGAGAAEGGAGAGGGEAEAGGGAAQLAHALLAFHENAADVMAPHRLAVSFSLECLKKQLIKSFDWFF